MSYAFIPKRTGSAQKMPNSVPHPNFRIIYLRVAAGYRWRILDQWNVLIEEGHKPRKAQAVTAASAAMKEIRQREMDKRNG